MVLVAGLRAGRGFPALLFASALLLMIGSVHGLEGVALKWSHVSCDIKTKKANKHLLHNICGKAEPGRLLAIMGPSGSGKTTLLNALAGQLVQTRGLSLEGTMMVNGELSRSGTKDVPKAYVRQEDIFYTQMTVEETLNFHAKLRLPKDMPDSEKQDLVEGLMSKLALQKAKNTIVGGGRVRGVSGGERKRLSIACELISNPKLIFLDEPTSGLDSFQAEKVVRTLQVLAKEGNTVVCVIHQPSGTIFNMFDDLLLLAEGRMQFFGPAQEVTSYFKGLGLRCPPGINAGEFALNAVSINFESRETESASRKHIHDFAVAYHAKFPFKLHAAHSAGAAHAPARKETRGRPVAGFFTQMRLLFARSLREVTRNKAANMIKLVQQLSTALIYGGIYSLSDSQSSIQDRLGLISLMAIGNTNLALAGTIRAFPKEKTIVMNDRSKNIYGAVPYFFSKVLAEAPVSAALSLIFGGLLYPLVGFQRDAKKFVTFLGINTLHSFASSAVGLLLGAVAPSSDASLALLPPVIVLMIIFNGFNITEENTPKLLWWLPKISVIRWGFEGLCLNEFEGLTFTCDKRMKQMCVSTGEEALMRVSTSISTATVRRSIMAQAAILGACYLQTLNVLCQSGPKFAVMEHPAHLLPGGAKEHDTGHAYVHEGPTL